MIMILFSIVVVFFALLPILVLIVQLLQENYKLL